MKKATPFQQYPPFLKTSSTVSCFLLVLNVSQKSYSSCYLKLLKYSEETFNVLYQSFIFHTCFLLLKTPFTVKTWFGEVKMEMENMNFNTLIQFGSFLLIYFFEFLDVILKEVVSWWGARLI